MRYAITLSAVVLTPFAALGGTCDPATQFSDPPTVLPFADVPAGVAAGDFNLDGVTDLAVSLPNADAVSVFLGNGDGTLTFASTNAAGAFPLVLELADLNGDGADDIVCLSGSVSTFSVLISNRDGAFQPMVEYPLPSRANDIALGDLNEDGAQDIFVPLVTAATSHAVFLGNGDGTFQTALLGGLDDTQLAVFGHFNNDTHLDIAMFVVPNQVTRTMLGNGDGTFQPSTPVGLGDQNIDLASADLNGDGFDDLVVGDDSGVVFVVLSNGDGTFASPLVYPAGVAPVNITIADLSGDLVPDIAASDITTGALIVLIGNGDGTFQSQNQFPTGGDVFDVAAGDFNNDSAPELVVTDPTNSALKLFTNSCGPFTLTIAPQPPSIVVDEGGAALFPVSIVPNDPTATYQWRHDGVPLVDGPDVTGALSAILVLSNITTEDVGIYDVIATNAFGSTLSTPGVLAVRSAPDCPGDADGSMTVDFNDLVATLFLFGPCK